MASPNSNVRWTSRKFLITLATQVAAVIAIAVPQYGDFVHQALTVVVALITLVLSQLGYVISEGGVDAARAAGKKDYP